MLHHENVEEMESGIDCLVALKALATVPLLLVMPRVHAAHTVGDEVCSGRKDPRLWLLLQQIGGENGGNDEGHEIRRRTYVPHQRVKARISLHDSERDRKSPGYTGRYRG